MHALIKDFHHCLSLWNVALHLLFLFQANVIIAHIHWILKDFHSFVKTVSPDTIKGAAFTAPSL